MVDFGGCEYSSPLDEAGKEVRLDIDARIDTQAINTVVGHHLLDPVAEHGLHISILCSEICQRHLPISEPANLGVGCVAGIVHCAVVVVVLAVVERVEDAVIDIPARSGVSEVIDWKRRSV